jgi:probable rRNA maturation factor
MRALNRAWRGMDRTTDVLSFSMLEGDVGGMGGAKTIKTREGRKSPHPPFSKGGRRGDFRMEAADAPPLTLGDIVISAPRASVQAWELGQSLEDELIFLLVHGILHLVGYDHEGTSAGRLKMERIQRKLIKLLTAAR